MNITLKVQCSKEVFVSGQRMWQRITCQLPCGRVYMQRQSIETKCWDFIPLLCIIFIPQVYQIPCTPFPSTISGSFSNPAQGIAIILESLLLLLLLLGELTVLNRPLTIVLVCVNVTFTLHFQRVAGQVTAEGFQMGLQL